MTIRPAPRLPSGPEAVRKWARQPLLALGFNPDIVSVHRLPCHASSRLYYRIAELSGRSVVAMFGTDWGTDYLAVPDRNLSELPFVSLARFFGDVGVPVPTLLHHDDETDWMLIEDLGDGDLATVIAETQDPLALLKGAFFPILQIQRATDHARRAALPALRRRMDRATIIWEFDHYREWGIEQLYDVTLAPAHSAMIGRAFERLTEEILAAGFCLAHRDYNATNVKLRASGETVIIDFQDAALASPAYDVASLVFDANISRYVGSTMRREAVLAWIEAAALPVTSARLIDIQGLQRCLKAAGRFVWLARVRGKTSFLDLLPETLALAREVMVRHPDLADLAEALSQYEPRLRSDLC